MGENKEGQQPDKLNIDETLYETSLTHKFQSRKKFEQENPKMVKAFIPGVIRNLSVTVGNRVREGEILLILEAMKMENKLLAPMDGLVKTINIEEGQMVTKNQVLIELE